MTVTDNLDRVITLTALQVRTLEHFHRRTTLALKLTKAIAYKTMVSPNWSTQHQTGIIKMQKHLFDKAQGTAARRCRSVKCL